MAITITINESTVTIAETGQSLTVTTGAAATLSVAAGAQGSTNLVVSGTAAAGQSFAVNDLVFPDGDTVYLADNTNIARLALGVVTRVLDDTIYYVPAKAALNVTPTGAAPAGHKTLYLGTAGGSTFTAPAYGSGLLRQIVGHAYEDNGDSTYDALYNCSHNAMPV